MIHEVEERIALSSVPAAPCERRYRDHTLETPGRGNESFTSLWPVGYTRNDGKHHFTTLYKGGHANRPDVTNGVETRECKKIGVETANHFSTLTPFISSRCFTLLVVIVHCTIIRLRTTTEDYHGPPFAFSRASCMARHARASKEI